MPSKRVPKREIKSQPPSFAVPYIDFPAQFKPQRRRILKAVENLLKRGDFILGAEVAAFEKRFARLCGVRHAVGVANGTDALIMAMKALGIGKGDEVITAPNSFIASASSIVLAGAKPVFVDVGRDMTIDPALIEKAVTRRTRAIMPVHLTGKCADMKPILEIARRRRLFVIEDAAQSVGAGYRGQSSGSFGTLGCFSLHPLKNLNAIGDAGVITTDDDQLNEKLRLMRNHGLRTRDEVAFWGLNSRLDTIQAAVLNVRLDALDGTIQIRRRIANRYRRALTGIVECPIVGPHDFHTYHVFIIQASRRNELEAFLRQKGVDTRIHYPIPIHLQPCSSSLGYRRGDFPVCEEQSQKILSLPVHQCMTDARIDRVCDSILAFYRQRPGVLWRTA